MYDPHTRESRGFGFVTMETQDAADAAVAALSNAELLGKTIRVEKVQLVWTDHQSSLTFCSLVVTRLAVAGPAPLRRGSISALQRESNVGCFSCAMAYRTHAHSR